MIELGSVLVFVGSACIFALISPWIYDAGFDAGNERAMRYRAGIDDKRFINALTKRLDIQADGGEGEDFVRYAVWEAIKDVETIGMRYEEKHFFRKRRRDFCRRSGARTQEVRND
ncbi:hypothetical protein [Xanthomonas albilineans]|uniref:hypothetical protein n=1 Tax=Xanthomonas albilineans TaxID=29447 RepID=UPI000AD9A225|nr:hypothetical protein [Xanthomonas albilineans]